MSEEWRPVIGYEGCYEVSDQGRVRSVDRQVYHSPGRSRLERGCILKQGNSGPYWLIVLRAEGRRRTRWVHQLVLEAFRGQCPSGMESRHLDDNGKNNRLTNLRWGTRRENGLDRHVNKGWRQGGECSYAKLDEQTVAVIRNVASKLFTPPQIAKALGVDRTLVWMIIRGKVWKHVE